MTADTVTVVVRDLLAARTPAPGPGDEPRAVALARLAAAWELAVAVEGEVEAAMLAAHTAGAGWGEIGRVAGGMTRQGARQRWARLTPPPAASMPARPAAPPVAPAPPISPVAAGSAVDADVDERVAARLVHGLLARLSDRDRVGVLAALSATERPVVARIADHGRRLAADPTAPPVARTPGPGGTRPVSPAASPTVGPAAPAAAGSDPSTPTAGEPRPGDATRAAVAAVTRRRADPTGTPAPVYTRTDTGWDVSLAGVLIGRLRPGYTARGTARGWIPLLPSLGVAGVPGRTYPSRDAATVALVLALEQLGTARRRR
ncbi:hypothetical protein [Frankia sp. Cas3]|uniref:hypothetical protein n=1 Tax=Frankia sp. Cas3 TaxID=3073926 RepID=UPI002AD42812|nr:hypothetical protein [Frankia sp. Cas3]